MTSSNLTIILFAIICNFSLSILTNVNADDRTQTQPGQSNGLDEMAEDELDDSDESDDSARLFSEQLQQNYHMGIMKMSNFFNSTDSVLTTINAMLKDLDNKVHQLQEEAEAEKTSRSADMRAMEAQLATLTSQLAQVTATTPKPTTNTLNVNSYLSKFAQPTMGSSYAGQSAQQIANAVEHNNALAVEILNYLESSLTDHRYDLVGGSVYKSAQSTVYSNRREIFTYGRTSGRCYPHGTMLYRIGNTGYSLHVYFWPLVKRYAAAILSNSASVETLIPIRTQCSAYTHTGSSDSFQCIERADWNDVKTMTIHQNSVYAKLTINYKEKTSILKIEIFKLN